MRPVHSIDDRVVRSTREYQPLVGHVTGIMSFTMLHKVKHSIKMLANIDYLKLYEFFDTIDADWRDSYIYYVAVEYYIEDGGKTHRIPENEISHLCCESELLPLATKESV